jgi:hypothetical protein
LSETPLWRATRDTTLPVTNSLVMKDAIVRRAKRPNHYFEPANDAAREVDTGVPQRREGAEPMRRMPFSGLEALSVDRNGTMFCRAAAPGRDYAQPTRPKYRYVGDGFGLAFGEFCRHGQTVVSEEWPRYGEVEPANSAAEEVWAYWSQHRGEVLPPEAWDYERQCVNRLPDDPR